MPRHNLQFLVADPDPRWQRELREAILEAGYGLALEARQMSDALRILASGSVDFIICDWSAETFPGLGLLKAVKAQEASRYIPFLMIATSSANNAERVRRATAAAVDGFLLKPFTRELFRQVIEDIVSRYPNL